MLRVPDDHGARRPGAQTHASDCRITAGMPVASMAKSAPPVTQTANHSTTSPSLGSCMPWLAELPRKANLSGV